MASDLSSPDNDTISAVTALSTRENFNSVALTMKSAQTLARSAPILEKSVNVLTPLTPSSSSATQTELAPAASFFARVEDLGIIGQSVTPMSTWHPELSATTTETILADFEKNSVELLYRSGVPEVNAADIHPFSVGDFFTAMYSAAVSVHNSPAYTNVNGVSFMELLLTTIRSLELEVPCQDAKGGGTMTMTTNYDQEEEKNREIGNRSTGKGKETAMD